MQRHGDVRQKATQKPGGQASNSSEPFSGNWLRSVERSKQAWDTGVKDELKAGAIAISVLA